MSEQPTPEATQEQPETPASTWTPPSSQEALNQIIEDRLARERRKFADYDDLKKRSDGYEQALVDAKTEGERSASEKFVQRLINTEVTAGAKALGFHDPADAVGQLGDMSTATKDGEVDSEAISKALAELAEQKPYLLAQEEATRPRSRPKVKQTADSEEPEKNNAAGLLRAFAANR